MFELCNVPAAKNIACALRKPPEDALQTQVVDRGLITPATTGWTKRIHWQATEYVLKVTQTEPSLLWAKIGKTARILEATLVQQKIWLDWQRRFFTHKDFIETRLRFEADDLVSMATGQLNFDTEPHGEWLQPEPIKQIELFAELVPLVMQEAAVEWPAYQPKTALVISTGLPVC